MNYLDHPSFLFFFFNHKQCKKEIPYLKYKTIFLFHFARMNIYKSEISVG